MNTSVSISTDPWDLIDELHRRCGGEPLRIDNAGAGGETDALRLITGRDVQRFAAAGLIARNRGLRVDELADRYGWMGTPADFADFYLEQCERGLDARRARRNTRTAWETQERPEWSYTDE